jgi:hypothetical protein
MLAILWKLIQQGLPGYGFLTAGFIACLTPILGCTLLRSSVLIQPDLKGCPESAEPNKTHQNNQIRYHCYNPFNFVFPDLPCGCWYSQGLPEFNLTGTE